MKQFTLLRGVRMRSEYQTFTKSTTAIIYEINRDSEWTISHDNVVENDDSYHNNRGIYMCYYSKAFVEDCFLVGNDYSQLVDFSGGSGEMIGERVFLFGNSFGSEKGLEFTKLQSQPFTHTLKQVNGYDCNTPMYHFSLDFSEKKLFKSMKSLLIHHLIEK